MAQVSKLIRLSLDNHHLLDIFTDQHYLELGNIDIAMMEQLLNHKSIFVNELVEVDFLSRNVGASHITDPQLRSILPFVWFDNLQKKNASLQLFITYGLIQIKMKHRREQFAPLILIPIDLYYEHHDVVIQMVGQPIENKIVLNELKSEGIDIVHNEKLNDLYSMERYCMLFSKYDSLMYKIENYLTFGEVIEQPLVLNHDQFSLKNNFNAHLGSQAYLNEESELYAITPLNTKQRLAVQRASTGNQFALTGPAGTGKTTTLINIACDAIVRNKRVLYISNMAETLDAVYRHFMQYGLEFLVLNLSNSSSEFQKSTYFVSSDTEYAIKDLKQQLLKSYDLVHRYEQLMSQRIQNVRFNEVVHRLIMQPKMEKPYQLDSTDELYKNEAEEIIESLKVIEEQMKKIKRFKESKFISIPIQHTIKYPNQVLTLLFQIHQQFVQLQASKVRLETGFGFRTIPNYARFKNVINNFKALDIKKVPQSWKEDIQTFHQAFDQFQHLKSDIYLMQEYELYLDWDFQNITTIDIDDTILQMLDGYFEEKDVAKIDRVIEKNLEILVKFRIAQYHSKVFERLESNIASLLGWSFDMKSELTLQEIVRLTQYMNENFVYSKWLNTKKAPQMREVIQATRDKLVRYHQLKKQFTPHLVLPEEITLHIQTLELKREKAKLYKKIKTKTVDVLISDLREYHELHQQIDRLNQTFYKQTGSAFDINDDILKDFDATIHYLNHCATEDIKLEATKFLTQVNYNEIGTYLEELNTFCKAYQMINEAIAFLKFYGIEKTFTSFTEKQTFVDEMYAYISQVRVINMQMGHVVKNAKAFVPFEMYLRLRDRLHQLKDIKKKIRRNKEYARIYGNLFEQEKTNVNDVGMVLKSFHLFIDCFNDTQALYRALDVDTHPSIIQECETAEQTIDEINQEFKLYSKIFKDGIGSYYYDDFDTVIHHFSELKGAKDELITYLDITDHLKVLAKYKLYLLSNLIINNEITDMVNAFKDAYYSRLYTLYITQYPFLKETATLQDHLHQIDFLEKNLLLHHIKILQERANYKMMASRIATASAHRQLKGSKLLYLIRPSTLNHGFELDDFDLILIDDAHLLRANAYSKAFVGTQVIIAGEDTPQNFARANLISRIRAANTMTLDFRYRATPLQLMATEADVPSVFLPKASENNGLEVIYRDMSDVISELFVANPDITINVFTPTLTYKQKIMESVASKCSPHLSKKKLIYLLTQQLNVVDLFSGYAIDADYNAFYLDEYAYADDEFITPRALTTLFVCKKKCMVFMTKKRSLSDIHSRFMTSFMEVYQKKATQQFMAVEDILLKIAQFYGERDIIVHGSYHHLGLVLEKNNHFFGILLYLNPLTTHMDILEDFRDYQQTFTHGKIPIFPLWMIDLHENFTQTLEAIAKAVIG